MAINFYNDEAVSAAKDLLYRNLEQLKIDGLRCLVKRKGDNKVKMDVKDTFTLMNVADKNLNSVICRYLSQLMWTNNANNAFHKAIGSGCFVLAQKVGTIEEQLKLQATAAAEATHKAELHRTEMANNSTHRDCTNPTKQLSILHF